MKYFAVLPCNALSSPLIFPECPSLPLHIRRERRAFGHLPSSAYQPRFNPTFPVLLPSLFIRIRGHSPPLPQCPPVCTALTVLHLPSPLPSSRLSITTTFRYRVSHHLLFSSCTTLPLFPFASPQLPLFSSFFASLFPSIPFYPSFPSSISLLVNLQCVFFHSPFTSYYLVTHYCSTSATTPLATIFPSFFLPLIILFSLSLLVHLPFSLPLLLICSSHFDCACKCWRSLQLLRKPGRWGSL